MMVFSLRKTNTVSLLHWLLLVLSGCNTQKVTKSTSNATTGTTGTAVSNSSGSSSTTGGPRTVIPASSTPLACNATAPADVMLTINPQQGPLGRNQPLPITNNLYSMNIDDQVRSDFVPQANADFVALLKALRPAQLRFPAGAYGQRYTWSTSTDGPFLMTPMLVDAFVALCRAVGAQPYLAINIDNGTVSDAQSFLTYVNITKNYQVQWWQLGNEPDVGGLGNPYTPQSYANNYLNFATSLKTVDPNIKLVGAELLTGSDIIGFGSDTNWLTPILQVAGSQMDAIAWHYYPLASSQNNPNSSATMSITHLLQEDAPDWPPAGLDYASTITQAINVNLAQYAPQAENWIDEFAEDPGPSAGAGLSDRMVGAVWAADALGRYAENGINRIFKFIYKGDGTQSYTLLDGNNNPRPEYYTYWLYAQQFGDNLVAATSSNIAQVAVHASLLSVDNSLRLMVVNKQTTAQTVALQLGNFTPTTAGIFALTATALDASSAQVAGQTLSTANVGNGPTALLPQAIAACNTLTLQLQPGSVNLLVFNSR